MRASFETFMRMYGRVTAPTSVWQEQSHGNNRALQRLAIASHSLHRPEDLAAFVHDLNYVEPLQPDLLQFVFPDLLKVWRNYLMTDKLGGIVEQFCAAVSYKQPSTEDPKARASTVLQLLSEEQRTAAAWLMRNAILDSLGVHRGLAFSGMLECTQIYAAVGAVVSYGTTFPDIGGLWEEWWKLDTPGLASSALCYASSLMYADDANPVFARWTCDRGGGPPCLWESESFNSWSELWLPENVAFLVHTLTVDYLGSKVAQAAALLAGEAEGAVAAQIHSDFAGAADLVALRIAELIRLLSKPGAGGRIDWTV